MTRPLAVLLLACLAAAPALASSPRLFALGGDGAYLEDAVNARAWYGSLADHGGWIAVESGVYEQYDGYARDVAGRRATGPAAGLHLPLGDEGRHGTAALWWNGRPGTGGVPDLGDEVLADSWQVMYALRRSGLAAGLSLRHGGGEHDLSPFWRRTTTRDDFGLGARAGLGETAYVDVAGEVVRLAEKNSYLQEDPVESSSYGSYGFRARVFAQLSPGLVLVPVIERLHEENADTGLRAGAHRTVWRLGAGLTWLPDPDHLALLALERRDGQDSPWVGTGDIETFTARLAFEARIHALLSVRLGGGYRIRAYEPASGRDATFHDVPFSAGLAAHLGPADLEFAVANLPPDRATGVARSWTWHVPNDATWMSAGASWWF